MTRRRVGVTTTLAVAAATTAGLGGFLCYGARVVHPVSVADAQRMYAATPAYAGRGVTTPSAAGRKPAAGVYRYATSGSARVDRLGLNRRYPALTARLIRHGPGCEWSETVPILREHIETYTACAAADDQLDTGFATRLTYFFVPATSESQCSPAGSRTAPERPAGSVIRFRCVDQRNDVRTEGTVTFQGSGSVLVDGARQPCRQVRIVTVLHGRTSGAAVRELCTEADTGLVLRETRSVGLTARSRLIGRLRYVESATFTLQSMAPLT